MYSIGFAVMVVFATKNIFIDNIFAAVVPCGGDVGLSLGKATCNNLL